MRNLRFAAPALALALLLGSTAGLVAHDHLAEAPADGYDCVSDHRSDSTSASSSSAPELRSSAPRHHHICLGCRLVSSRSLLLPRVEAATGPAASPDDLLPLSSSAPRPAPLAGVLVRGPPSR
jgi:hypothetical protein